MSTDLAIWKPFVTALKWAISVNGGNGKHFRMNETKKQTSTIQTGEGKPPQEPEI